MTKNFVSAVLGAPVGLEGFIKVRSLSGETEHLAALKSAKLRLKGREREALIEAVRGSGGGFAMKFAGVDSPEAAKELTGAEIVTDREHAAPLGKNELYAEDLKGLVLSAPDGTVIGTITDIVEGGGGNLAEVLLTGSGDAGSAGVKRFVPWRKEFVGEVDLEKGTAVLLDTGVLE